MRGVWSVVTIVTAVSWSPVPVFPSVMEARVTIIMLSVWECSRQPVTRLDTGHTAHWECRLQVLALVLLTLEKTQVIHNLG